jgi:predicted site-specific integrase-resolvase
VRTLIQWSEFLGIAYHTLRRRLREGWSIERAFTEGVE